MHDQQLRGFVIRSEVQPPADLIRSATSTAAQLLRMAGRWAWWRPGAFADLLVIDGNPLEDIRVLTTPEQTLKLIMKERPDLQERAVAGISGTGPARP